MWALAGQSGYIHRFNICGDNLQNMTEAEMDDLEPGIGASGQTVLSLVKGIPTGSELFFDNYFASPALLLKLKEMGIPAACTLRTNRMANCPLKTEKVLRKEGRGSVDFKVSEEGIILARWYDIKEVTAASNHYSVQPTSEVRRWDKKKNVYVNIPCPAMIQAYNKGMGGVDHCDQLLSFYR